MVLFTLKLQLFTNTCVTFTQTQTVKHAIGIHSTLIVSIYIVCMYMFAGFISAYCFRGGQ